MHFLQILILAVVQGAAELLPVSSSAHVIVAEKLMGLDPSSPEMTMLLVMLHTGTMFAVIAYFWNSWRRDYFSSGLRFKDFLVQVIAATICTGVVGYGIQEVIEKVFMHGMEKAEIEDLFSNLPLIAGALFAVGLLIIYSGLRLEKNPAGAPRFNYRKAAGSASCKAFASPSAASRAPGPPSPPASSSVSPRQKLEEFSFALAVVLTPPVIAKEALRLLKANKEGAHIPIMHLLAPSLVGMVFSFGAGLLALKWLSRWLEGGQWKLFGFYCLAASIVVLALHFIVGI